MGRRAVDKISFAVVVLFTLLLAYFSIRMVWVIGRNLVQGRLLRRRLRQRLAGMPLEQALERSGADPTVYLHDRQLHEIEREMRNCEGCKVTAECSGAMGKDTPTEKFDFCPNYDALFKPKKIES